MLIKVTKTKGEPKQKLLKDMREGDCVSVVGKNYILMWPGGDTTPKARDGYHPCFCFETQHIEFVSHDLPVVVIECELHVKFQKENADAS